MIQLIGHNSKAIVDEKNKLIMMHTPRSGSTVAMKAFYEHLKLLKYIENIEYKYHSLNESVHSTKQCKTLNNVHLNGNYFIFKIIRNPYARAVSMLTFIKKMYSHVDVLQELSLYDILKILDSNNGYFTFNSISKNILLNLPEHFIQQYVKDEEKYINTYIKIENGQKELNTKINTPFKINIIIDNKTAKHHTKRIKLLKKTNIFLGKTPIKKISTFHKDYKVFYNDEIKRLVDKIYIDDLKHYNYKF